MQLYRASMWEIHGRLRGLKTSCKHVELHNTLPNEHSVS